MRRAALLLAVATVVATAAAVAYAAQSPKALRATIVGAAGAQRSVHYVAHNVIGNALITLKADVAADRGSQHIVIQLGKRTGKVTIYLVDQTAYVEGDAFGLQALQGLTKAQSTKYAGQWISIPKGDKSYASTAADVTLPSFVHTITPRGKLASISGKVRGVRVVGIRGSVGKGKRRTLMALLAPAKGKKLPLESDEFAPGESSIGHTAISKWNEPVTVQAPASSTPIGTVRGG